ncbi:Uncharacterised protein [Mycobacterium tuberculosis]|uniref:Uncharacterized protein n=1 Tax=Mycobacterium tuberculosis TaxID=1773 RepID=A0A655JN54_MYCTX|nr:Uncharacterised protein [Mycobacterium tuberculosis]CKR64488.1 Uncharacterised protein [Mycobacterium tuberculosis]CKT00690.1 Uncharacterised protein [Mycobacterium tuberculosis]CKT39037.1 Uncharacterised protein [Mycobacterium tuberculosis]COV90735.1 Uncharacterised protein [Mycobacterium tuberculosis]
MFHRLRNTRSDGFADSVPSARHALMSALSAVTVQLNALRRAPKWRAKLAACVWVGFSVNRNACTHHPSGTFKRAIT